VFLHRNRKLGDGLMTQGRGYHVIFTSQQLFRQQLWHVSACHAKLLLQSIYATMEAWLDRFVFTFARTCASVNLSANPCAATRDSKSVSAKPRDPSASSSAMVTVRNHNYNSYVNADDDARCRTILVITTNCTATPMYSLCVSLPSQCPIDDRYI
jgi:hypothetical protein